MPENALGGEGSRELSQLGAGAVAFAELGVWARSLAQPGDVSTQLSRAACRASLATAPSWTRRAFERTGVASALIARSPAPGVEGERSRSPNGLCGSD